MAIWRSSLPTAAARRVVSFYDLAFLRVPEFCSPKIVGPFARNVPRFADAADAIITCSEATKRDVVELLGVAEDKVAVAYGAVDESLSPLPRPEAEALLAQHYDVRPPYVLFVSTLEPRKNVAGLVRAFAAGCRDLPHRLVLVGGAGWGATAIEEAKVDISENYQAGADVLGIEGQSGSSGTVGPLSWTWNASTGVLTLTGTAFAG